MLMRDDQNRAWRRGARWLGWLLIAGGVGVLVWVAWQMWGTSWQSEREHREIVESLEERWAGPEAPEEEQEGPKTVGEWPAKKVSAIVRVPKFGDDYAVPVLEGMTDEVLAAGFGHFEHSAEPGGEGNYAIAGHRVTHGEPLRDMPELEPGDEVIVETREAVHTYVLDTGGDDLEVPFTETWVVDAVPTNPRRGGVQPPLQEEGQSLLSLTTCAELFHTDQRMVAFGRLAETEPK